MISSWNNFLLWRRKPRGRRSIWPPLYPRLLRKCRLSGNLKRKRNRIRGILRITAPLWVTTRLRTNCRDRLWFAPGCHLKKACSMNLPVPNSTRSSGRPRSARSSDPIILLCNILIVQIHLNSARITPTKRPAGCAVTDSPRTTVSARCVCLWIEGCTIWCIKITWKCQYEIAVLPGEDEGEGEEEKDEYMAIGIRFEKIVATAE